MLITATKVAIIITINISNNNNDNNNSNKLKHYSRSKKYNSNEQIVYQGLVMRGLDRTGYN